MSKTNEMLIPQAGQHRFNWMPILRTGTFTDKNNQTVTIDEAALDKIISATDLAKEPQLVVEHPKFDEVGFGTIEQLKKAPSGKGESLSRSAGGWILFALPKTVNEKFKKAVNSGKLPGRSVTLDKNSYALKNISFLPPDVPPAVTGLGAYSFSVISNPSPRLTDGQAKEKGEVLSVPAPQSGGEDLGEASFVEGEMKMQLALSGEESHFADLESSNFEMAMYEVSNWPFKTIQTLFRNIKNYLIEKAGIEKADMALPEFYLSEVGNPPALIDKEPLENKSATHFGSESHMASSFSQNINGDNMTIDLSKLDLSKPDQLKAAIEGLQTENTRLTTDIKAKDVELQAANLKLTDAETEKIKSEVIQFCDTDGKKKIKPANKDKAVNFLMAQKEKGVIEFSVTDTAGGTGTTKVQLNTFDFAKELIKGLPDFVTEGEIATVDNAGVKDSENSEVLAQKALEFQAAELKAGRTVSVSAAVAHVKSKMSK